MTMQHKRGNDKGKGFDGAIANITQPTSHMPTVEVSLTVNYSSAIDLQIVTIRRWWKQLTLSQATLLLLWCDQWPYLSVD